MKKLLILLCCCLFIPKGFACLILFISDGKNMLVANHEDWYAEDAEISFTPAIGKKLGMVYFDFASEKTAQGGMNTAGLFFDGTRTPYAPYAANQKKPSCDCYIWKKILEECTTTDQAIEYVKKYQIPEIEEIHVMLADRRGHSVVMGVYDGALQIHPRAGNVQLLTNFNLCNPSYGDELPCPRFATASSMLNKDSAATVANLERILSKTHQDDLTAYSYIDNLSTGDIYLYQKANFQQRVQFNLFNELKKGTHSLRISALFKSSR